jgi:branched-chain amino acid aminotransferase
VRVTACDNALILDAHGHICETASGSIFWVKNGVLYTPEESLPFIPGTVRKKLLALSPFPVRMGRYTLFDIAAADEVFMTNVGTLIAAVAAIKPLGYRAAGDEVTRSLRALLVADAEL